MTIEYALKLADSYKDKIKLPNKFNIDDIDDRSEALRICVKKLPENMQQLIRLRYAKGLTIKDVALKVSKPVHGMYKRIAKVHFLLQGCIEKTLAAWSVN